MTLEKAIEILDLNVKEAGKKMPPDTLHALKLGLEAGKRIETGRARFDEYYATLLPGETEE